MDAPSLRASLVSQRDAAQWYASARRWVENVAVVASAAERAICTGWAIEDQRIAAQLSLADRTFRGLEG